MKYQKIVNFGPTDALSAKFHQVQKLAQAHSCMTANNWKIVNLRNACLFAHFLISRQMLILIPIPNKLPKIVNHGMMGAMLVILVPKLRSTIQASILRKFSIELFGILNLAFAQQDIAPKKRWVSPTAPAKFHANYPLSKWCLQMRQVRRMIKDNLVKWWCQFKLLINFRADKGVEKMMRQEPATSIRFNLSWFRPLWPFLWFNSHFENN